MTNDLISRQAAIDAIVNTVSAVGLHDNSETALAIRDKVIEMEYPYWEPIEGSYAVMPLRGNNELCPIGDWFDGAKYVVVDTNYKIDTGVYGAYWYSKDGIEE